MGFQQGTFTGKLKEAGCRVCDQLCTVLWLVDGKVTGWCLQGLTSGSRKSGGYILMVKLLTSSAGWGFSIYKTTKKRASRTVICVIHGKTKDSVIAFGWYPVCIVIYSPDLTATLVHYLFTSFQSLSMQARLCDSGGAWETSALLQAEDMWGEVCPGKAQRGLLGYNVKCECRSSIPELGSWQSCNIEGFITKHVCEECIFIKGWWIIF